MAPQFRLALGIEAINIFLQREFNLPPVCQRRQKYIAAVAAAHDAACFAGGWAAGHSGSGTRATRLQRSRRSGGCHSGPGSGGRAPLHDTRTRRQQTPLPTSPTNRAMQLCPEKRRLYARLSRRRAISATKEQQLDALLAQYKATLFRRGISQAARRHPGRAVSWFPVQVAG